MNLKIMAVLISLAICAAATPCLCAPPSQPRRILRAEFFKRKIDLDKSQEEKMEMLLFDYNKGKIKKEEEIQLRELDFMELFNQDAPDYDKLQAKFKEITSLQADLGSYRVRKLLSAHDFLKDDQFKKYKKMLLRIFFQ